MPATGVQPTGFISPTQQEIVQDINARLLADFPTLDLDPDQPIGQIVGIVAEKIAEVWEAVQTIYTQTDPDSAEGVLLDELSAITGTRRRSATYSTVAATLNVNAGSTVPAGSIAAVAGQPANRWVLEADVVNSGGTAANLAGTFRSEQPGPFAANAGTLTDRVTSVIGWNSVTNAADAVQGIVEDSDATLRARRQAELAAPGACTLDAIRADLLQVKGVLQAFVLENDTDVYDTDGLPPHSFTAIVYDGLTPQATDTDIAQAIWNDKPTGIKTFGSTTANATDSTGTARAVSFSRATVVPIYLDVTVAVDSTYPVTGDSLIKAALAAFALANWNLGTDVIAERLKAVCFSVQGVVDVGTLLLDTHSSPSGTTNIPISQFQIASLSTTNIAVHS